MPKYQRNKIAKLGVLALTAGILGASAQAQIYDLTTDFSLSSNPNGAWSYELSGVPISGTVNLSFGRGWSDYGSVDASIFQIASPPRPEFQVGDVVLHAPSSVNGGVNAGLGITWTAPADGVISISGKAWGEFLALNRDAAWWLALGGPFLAYRGSVSGISRADTSAQFASNVLPGVSLSGIKVTAGERLTFFVGFKNVSANTFLGHFVGVQETINFTAVPEPSTISLVSALSLSGFAAIKMARRRAHTSKG
jgi:hypothetical protein